MGSDVVWIVTDEAVAVVPGEQDSQARRNPYDSQPMKWVRSKVAVFAEKLEQRMVDFAGVVDKVATHEAAIDKLNESATIRVLRAVVNGIEIELFKRLLSEADTADHPENKPSKQVANRDIDTQILRKVWSTISKVGLIIKVKLSIVVVRMVFKSCCENYIISLKRSQFRSLKPKLCRCQ